jgi:energy-coupling factor transporter ATP-binding protein EcfA2
MNKLWGWPGAHWWKFDFHAHTPASGDYGKGPNQAELKARTPKEWILDYMRVGIDCVAITDQNCGAWIDCLKTVLTELDSEKPVGYRRLYLFPGIEISVNGGVHVLAIFDLDKTTSDIDSLLGAVKFRGEKGSASACTESSFVDVIKEIREAEGLAIPAHVDRPNGLFKQFQGVTLSQALDCDGIMAIELFDDNFEKPQLYAERGLVRSEVLGSDSHHPAGKEGDRYPGSHFTWIKMGTPSLKGLSLALLDGSLSVRRSDGTQEDPNTHAPLIIESVEVSKSRYVGRSKTFQLGMNPWLNAIIGGRGTGKSTLVEFMRLALRRDKELPEGLQEEFSKYQKKYERRNDSGLLTEDSHFVVLYCKNGARYRIQWTERGDVDPIEIESDDGKWIVEQGEIKQRFPVRLYSQKQIFELAKAPLALLQIVDEAEGVDRRSWDERWKEEESKFLSLRAKAREIETTLGDESRLIGELEDVKRKLTVFESAGHSDILKEYQKRLRQQRAVAEWEKSWAFSEPAFRGLASDIVPKPIEPSLFDGSVPEDRELLEKAKIPLTRLEGLRTKLNEIADELLRIREEWGKERQATLWKQSVENAIQRYHSLLKELKDKDAGDPSAYGDLVQRRQEIEGRLRDNELQRKQLVSTRDDAAASLSRLKELRRELTKRRVDFLAKVLAKNDYVRIDVTPFGAKETAETELRKLIQREDGGFEKDIGQADGEGLLEELYHVQSEVKEMDLRLDQLRDKIRRIASGSQNSDKLQDRRFGAHLEKLPPEAFDRIDMWYPEDSLRVQYNTPSDGRGFRPIQEGSPGQKTAALLAFLLSYGDEPIVLDQPEDDLDNQLIYGLIVTQLRNIKQQRQAIVVTHNANIVVNGDAELVVALNARGGETHQECSGSLQEHSVRDTICAVMEGGREAFEHRYRRLIWKAKL